MDIGRLVHPEAATFTPIVGFSLDSGRAMGCPEVIQIGNEKRASRHLDKKLCRTVGFQTSGAGQLWIIDTSMCLSAASLSLRCPYLGLDTSDKMRMRGKALVGVQSKQPQRLVASL
jgi:hypothetical protein